MNAKEYKFLLVTLDGLYKDSYD